MEIEVYLSSVYLPSQSLEMLSKFKTPTPYIFMISNPIAKIKAYCGVLEFTAKNETVCLPYWLMEYLKLKDGDNTIIQSFLDAKKGSYIKIRPMQTIFIELSNPKTVIENKIKSYAVLFQGQQIIFKHLGIEYNFLVVKTEPSNVISITDVDNVILEFEEPADYKVVMAQRKEEAIKAKMQEEHKKSEEMITNFASPFKGKGVQIGSNLAIDVKPHQPKPPQQKKYYNPKEHRLTHGIVDM